MAGEKGFGPGTVERLAKEIAREFLSEIAVKKNGNVYLGGKQIKFFAEGEPGKKGYTPVKDKDYFDGVDGKTPQKGKDYRDGTDGKTPVKGLDYFDGVDGKTPVKGVDYRDGEDGKTPKKGVDYRDGVDGKTPVKGKDYQDGKNGVTPKHKWEGHSLRFQNPDGTWALPVDLRGKPGENGDTPQKGIDYSDGEPGKNAIIPKAVTQSVLADVEIINGKLQKKFQRIRIYPDA